MADWPFTEFCVACRDKAIRSVAFDDVVHDFGIARRSMARKRVLLSLITLLLILPAAASAQVGGGTGGGGTGGGGGFGGKTTLLGCKISALNRLPASFFVSVSYMCWAYRRQGIELGTKNEIKKWLY